MFGGFGAMELFLIAVVAIVVVGPKDMPKVMRSIMATVRKVREMGSEFQAGVKKMADEVELDAVTRKLNEAGNIKLEDDKPSTSSASSDTSSEFSDYEEFDYDQYDYEGGGNHTPTPSTEKAEEKLKEKVAAQEAETEEETPEEAAKDMTPEPPDIVEEPAEQDTISEEDVKSKKDD